MQLEVVLRIEILLLLLLLCQLDCFRVFSSALAPLDGEVGVDDVEKQLYVTDM